MKEGTIYRNSMRRHPQAWYYLLLTCAVTAAFLGSNLFMIVSGRELVWTQDAQPLYASFVVWGKQVIQGMLADLAAGNAVELPQYTYMLGYGADVPVSMGSYLQDPMNIIPALFPSELIGFSYALMTWARMVLAAITFSLYCFYHGHGRKATGVAAIAFVTCGFIIFLGAFRHTKFMDWSIILPLILLGADRLFDGRKPTLFIVALLLQFVTSAYFSYMSCVVLLIYCLIKYFFAPRQRSIGDFAKLVGQFLLFGTVAFLISAVLLIPQVIGLLSQGRATSGGAAVSLLFSLKYYVKIAAHLIGAAGTTDSLITGSVSTIGILVYLLCGKRLASPERKAWLVAFGCCVAGILIPYFSHVINGMGYSTDRWMLVFSFVCSYMLCMAYPQLSALSRAEWKRIGWGVAVIAALSIAYALAQVFMSDGLPGMVWPLVMSLVFIGVFFLVKKLHKERNSLAAAATTCCLVIACVTISATFYCSPLGENWGVTFPKSGTTWANLSDKTPSAAVEEIGDESLYRYTIPRVYNSAKNSALIHSVMGIDYYTSYYNQCVDDLRQELGISDHHMNFSFIGSDSRLALESIMGAKYYVAQSLDTWRVPYGFTDTGVKHGKFQVFENPHVAPLAFLSSGVISNEDYEALTMVQKQEALLQAAVVDRSEVDPASKMANVQLSSSEIPYEVVATKDLELDDSLISVTKTGATMTLRFDGKPRSETYVCITDFNFDPYSPSELAAAQHKTVTLKERLKDLIWTEPTTYPITAISGDRTKAANPATPKHLRYGGKKDWVLNLAYCEEPLKELTIEFENPGLYSFKDLSIVCQPVDPVVENLETVKASALDDLELYTNGMSASVTLSDDEPRVAVFMFAYTPGWSATVDGQPVSVLKTDTSFLGIEVKGAGKHEIAFSYQTPGVALGSILTPIGIIAFIIILLVYRRRGEFLKSHAGNAQGRS